MPLHDSTAVLDETGLDFAPGVIDPAHIGDIEGAFGTVSMHDHDARKTFGRKLLTLAAIMGPGIIVMVGDNDAGGVQTYTQAGQHFGYSLLWVMLILLPVLLINQEMVSRLGAVTGVGHARLIRERFGRNWAAFSVIDLFVLNFLTLLTEFIGVYFGLGYFGVPKLLSVCGAGALLFGIAATGRFRWWERFMFAVILASFVFVPAMLLAHPRWGPIGRDLVLPGMAGGVSSTGILLIVALIGTTVAPWQLFFQQSNVIDKRISPRWLFYERMDTFGGGILTTVAAAGMIVLGASLFHTKAFGPAAKYVDSGWFNHAVAVTLGPVAGALAAVMLVVAALVGAGAVSLSTSYAFGDSFNQHHSLHRTIRTAPVFYGAYALQIFAACLVVALGSNALLGTLTQYVQVLAGILLPSASLFLVLLCNDPAVLGPWVNGRVLNFFAVTIVGILIVLSLDLTISTLFSTINGVKLTEVCFGAGGLIAVVVAPVVIVARRRAVAAGKVTDPRAAVSGLDRKTWRMPPVALLERPHQTLLRTASVYSLRAYVIVAVVIVGVKVFSPFVH
ncbi:MAG: divalent metal cation transporter [Actinomycetota bacterium]|nr:divalent metal cation transporter [Actinomycetota bacterium]